MRTLVRRIGWPLAAFGAARGLLWGLAAWTGFPPSASSTWSRWDSAHYLAIATRGYDLFRCPPAWGWPDGWCGNAGWMPGYPALIWMLARLGTTPAGAGVLVSSAAHAATLVLLWNGFLAGRSRGEAVRAIFLAAFFPGQVYQHAVFPVALCTLLLTAGTKLAAVGRPLRAAVLGALAALTYATGFLFAGVVSIEAAVAPGPGPWRRAGQVLASTTIALSGLGAVLWLHQAWLGAWDAFFRVQAKYGHGLHSPLATLAGRASQLASPLAQAIPALQTLLVAALVPVLLCAIWRARDRTREEVALAVYALVYWSVPLVIGGGISLYRAESLLVPAAPLVCRLPRAAQVAILAIAIWLAVSMGVLFLRRALV
jgi:hypothetical protein